MIYTDPFIRSWLFHLLLNARSPVAVTSRVLLLVESFTSCGFAILYELMIQHKLGMGTYLQVNIRFEKAMSNHADPDDISGLLGVGIWTGIG